MTLSADQINFDSFSAIGAANEETLGKLNTALVARDIAKNGIDSVASGIRGSEPSKGGHASQISAERQAERNNPKGHGRG